MPHGNEVHCEQKENPVRHDSQPRDANDAIDREIIADLRQGDPDELRRNLDLADASRPADTNSVALRAFWRMTRRYYEQLQRQAAVACEKHTRQIEPDLVAWDALTAVAVKIAAGKPVPFLPGLLAKHARRWTVGEHRRKLQQRQRHEGLPLSQLADDGTHVEPAASRSAPTEAQLRPDEIAERTERRRLVTQAVTALKPQEREVVELYSGLVPTLDRPTFHKVSTALNVPLASLHRCYHATLEKLHRQLGRAFLEAR